MNQKLEEEKKKLKEQMQAETNPKDEESPGPEQVASLVMPNTEKLLLPEESKSLVKRKSIKIQQAVKRSQEAIQLN